MSPTAQYTAIIPAEPPVDTGPVPNPLPRLLAGEDLSADEAQHLFERLVLGRLEPGEIGGMLIALRMKGETPEEMIGAAQALLAAATPFERPGELFADCCGTGGDGAGTINVSTAAGLVAAAAGLPIAKHGNRSVSSRCGSADVLEALGARLELTPDEARRVLDQTGFTFLFAPAYHPGMKHAALVRRQLSVRTVMNLLGPCVNPARPPVQLLGVADPRLLRRIAQVLQALGVSQALVVHGSGLDEVALHADTRAIRLANGELEELVLTPEEVGFERTALVALEGGDPAVNAARLKDLLEGSGSLAEQQAVSLNAGALLWTAGLAPDFAAGCVKALDVLRSGAAGRTLAAFVEASRG
ncbi:anthranilate phosphoribosyltransferase [Sphingomonas astaxanthinifaciens]|uniref:Anthranilate phosphoribosyltransferase n=1 Tax=Sphingomonas astaxanthinifaciens DSM 22298 TaxID=1123267 RepID=A0ABQ5Z8F0_9SPHN|nr:anthranilate phosphoribosyltransferase [Sphingomonas astaxanthinifaciens]GLR47915.1 anthranilate phosphoribosyltransferase [Sphingomonas astaxanthinifaciens DSM 22298]